MTSVAPAGTISLLAGNISSGVEPVFSFTAEAPASCGADGSAEEMEVLDYAYSRLFTAK